MNAILTATISDLRRRRLQTVVIAIVLLLTSGAATLALSLLVESDAPYDHAFARANGAHLVLTYAANAVGPARLEATAHARGVTGSAGPWPEVLAGYSPASAQGPAGVLTMVGRAGPNTAVDRLTLESGRWPQKPGEVAVSQSLADQWSLSVGDRLTPMPGFHDPPLQIVGIAASISPYTDAWVLPGQISSLVSRRFALQYQMLYRVHPADTDAQLRRATQAITSGLPRGSVSSVNNYLQVKRDADITTAVMIPFLLAFSAFALAASVLIVANVVSGVVISSYRDIGIMKAVGFTPAGVVLVLLGQVLAPALAGCLVGIAIGTVASQPFLQDTAHALGLPAPFTAAIPVDLGVLALITVLVTLAALAPSLRAGSMSAVTAITTGSAPSTGGRSWLGRATARLPLPRPLGLGLGDSFTRPLRSAMTMGAILTGVATVIFALSLHLSLGQVAEHLIRDHYVQVDVRRMPAGGPGSLPLKGGGPGAAPPVMSDRQVVSLLRNDPGTARFVAEANRDITVPGIAEPIPYIAYRGSSSWIGYALISGRWFSHPGEVVAPTKLLNQAHLRVGDTITAHLNGKPMRLRIVGEILDQEYNDLFLRGTWSSLASVDSGITPDEYEVQLRPGTNPETYARQLPQPGLDVSGLDVSIVQQASSETAFILFNTVIGGLALVLTTIAAMGVFNTVILNTREKVRDIAVLKAVGMAPRQVVAMVLSSVALLGLIAGALAIPLGLALHREVITFMGQIATGTSIPPAFFDLIDHAVLPLLALAGVLIAALGAWIPAQWAASSRVTEVLQTE
jgi:putative ABC transport system permease protein